MTAIRSLEDLNKYREEVLKNKNQSAKLVKAEVIVGIGTCGIAAGALNTMKAIQEQIETEHLQGIAVSQTGCSGLCEEEPIVQVIVGGKHKVTYGKVTPEVGRRILREHIQDGKVVKDYVVEA
jgi:NADP-reducing hydrogenase subunit HndB